MHPNVAASVQVIGELLERQGKYEEALRHQRRALAIQEKMLGPEHPEGAGSLTDEAKALLGLGRAREAIAPLERVLTLRKRTPGRPVELPETQFTLARALWDSAQDRKRAKTLASEALAGYKAAGLRGKKEILVVEAWLAKHGGAR
jgi:tetratricopeptide (TPR) repeat protein